MGNNVRVMRTKIGWFAAGFVAAVVVMAVWVHTVIDHDEYGTMIDVTDGCLVIGPQHWWRDVGGLDDKVLYVPPGLEVKIVAEGHDLRPR